MQNDAQAPVAPGEPFDAEAAEIAEQMAALDPSATTLGPPRLFVAVVHGQALRYCAAGAVAAGEGERLVELPPDVVGEAPSGQIDQAAWDRIRAHLEAEGEINPVTHTAFAADVDAERDRRSASGFTFGGVRYQSRPQDRENMAGAAQLAALALLLGGKLPGDLLWHGGSEPFVWIGEDNSLNPMDASTVIAFAQAAAAWHHAHIFAGRALKDRLSEPGLDIRSDEHWPVSTAVVESNV